MGSSVLGRRLVPGLRLAALAALAALLVPLSGCTSCTPQLDVRHCAPTSPRCVPGPEDRTETWDATRAEAWPDIDALIRSLEPGMHAHEPWNETRTTTFWASWDIDPSAPEKQVFVQVDGQGDWYRLRVLECA